MKDNCMDEIVAKPELCLSAQIVGVEATSESFENKSLYAKDFVSVTEPNVSQPTTTLSECESVSRFASCISSQASSNDDSSDEGAIKNEGFKTLNENKRNKKSKRKYKMTPDKAIFLKKPNLAN